MKRQIKLICLSLLFLLIININILANEDTTIIDVSNMSIGENVVHNHMYKSQYDDTNHWTECLICHDKQNVTKHTITTTWAMGYESCHKNNYATKTCNCGYKTTYRRPCVWKGEYVSGGTNTFLHALKCSITNESIDGNMYYYTNTYGIGELKKSTGNIKCKTSNGTTITCSNGGTCATCKKTHTKSVHYFQYNNNCLLNCYYCGKNFGSYTINEKTNNQTPATYTTTITVYAKNGATFD